MKLLLTRLGEYLVNPWRVECVETVDMSLYAEGPTDLKIRVTFASGKDVLVTVEEYTTWVQESEPDVILRGKRK